MTDWLIRNDSQRDHFCRSMREWQYPYMAKLGPVRHPKTTQQIRHMHGLCRAIADYRRTDFERTKKDAKREWGVIEVYTSAVTGERTAELVSFEKYSREQSSTFISQAEAFCDEREIPYTPSEGE